jgi:hypothetical protein
MMRSTRTPRLPRPKGRGAAALEVPLKGRLAVLAALFLLVCPALPAHATTARDLRAARTIDGYVSDWPADEALFGYNAALKSLEEPLDDSKWGVNNDINQVLVTWDAHNLYLAGTGKTWGNNLLLLVDAIPGRGMLTMSGLNSWSRNISFDINDAGNGREFMPDLMGATWDGNPTPHLVIHQGGTQVTDLQVGGGQFQAASTFYQDRDGRAMELAIPWSTVFGNDPESRDTVVTVAGRTDTLRWFPPGRRLKLCGFITAGGDNTGGPDSAPDNTRGYVQDGNTAAYLDNYVEIPLDERDDTGLGHGGPDGIADWGVAPAARRTFKYPVPIVGVRFSLSTLEVNRPAFAPDRGEQVQFRFRMVPPLDPTDPLAALRTVDVSANVFDLRGNWVRNLYLASRRNALPEICAGCLSDPALDTWDGRDQDGRIVPPGIYVIRSVIEPNLSRQSRAVVVVR